MARRYARDNRGRFASGGGGATARGGRLRTAAGNKRKTQTMQASAAPKGTIGKPRGLKPQSARKLRTGIAVNRMRSINQKIGKGPDLAQINIKGRFTGQAGKRMDASIDRAVKQTKAAQTAALMKPKAQVRAERAAKAEANRAAQAAKPKRTRSVESLRASRAKQIEKRRSITTNPAGERASAAANMAANAARTQQRATAFYKAGGKPARAAATPRTGQEIMKADVRKVQNKKIRDLNRQIKEAGPNAAGLRLQKLQVQSRLDATRPRQTAKQAAKSAKQTEVVRGRIAEMRRQNARIGRATANKERTADTRGQAGSKMIRRPSQKMTRANNLADRALNFYANPAKALREVRKNRPGFRMPRTMR